MARKHHKPEEIVAKLRQVEVLVRQAKTLTDAVRAIGVTEATYYRWRSEFVGLKLDQVKRLKLLEQENNRLRQAVAGDFLDIRDDPAHADCHASDSWDAGQRLGHAVHAGDGDGVIYNSARWPGGSAAAVFWPNLITLPINQARQFRYRWDGSRMTHYFIHGSTDRLWHQWPPSP